MRTWLPIGVAALGIMGSAGAFTPTDLAANRYASAVWLGEMA